MPSTVEPVVQGARMALTHVLLVDDGPDGEAAFASVLPTEGYRLTRVDTGAGAVEALDRVRPHVVIVTDRLLAARPGSGGRGGDLLVKASALKVPVLAVVDDTSDPSALAERLAGVDDWVARRGLAAELQVRLTRLLAGRAGAGSSAPPADGQFFALVVHDLRTPLNVIGLSLRMISQAVPKGDADLEEDLRFVEENFRQIERMLSQLSDYYRLFENDGAPGPIEFNPKRLIDELLESRATKSGVRSSPVQVEAAPDCPEEVALDPGRARTALTYALANANAAAAGAPIRLRLRGGPDRWVTEIVLDTPPPASVRSCELSPLAFERLCGSGAERRGMDLAIAAKVTEGFGGSARLVAEPGKGTTVVLDWPARLSNG